MIQKLNNERLKAAIIDFDVAGTFPSNRKLLDIDTMPKGDNIESPSLMHVIILTANPVYIS
jgi:hypothetical protein